MLTGEMNEYIEKRLKNPEIKHFVKSMLVKDFDCEHQRVKKSKFRFKDGFGTLKLYLVYFDGDQMPCHAVKDYTYDQVQVYNLVKQAERVCTPDAVGRVVLRLFECVEECFRLYRGSMFDPLQNEINGARNRSHELMRMFGFDPYKEYNRLERERRNND